MNEPHRSDPNLIVLHALRCCGSASADRLEAVVAPLVNPDAESLLLTLAGQGLVTHNPGAFGGWELTDEGRRADAEWIAVELERADARADVQAAYEDFLALSQRTLGVCSDWQVRSWEDPMVLNDHTDEVYDADVLARLASVDAEVQAVCARLAARLYRFSHYGPRLATALGRARRGDLEQVTSSLDSYHTVWFQLHEDLLATLGLSREA